MPSNRQRLMTGARGMGRRTLGAAAPIEDASAMIGADNDLATAQAAMADATDTLVQLTAQAAGGDQTARTDSLPSAMAWAKSLRSFYTANVTGLDTGALDAAMRNAQNLLNGGAGASGSMFSKDGVRIGSVQIGWIGAVAGVTLLGIAIATLVHHEKKQARRPMGARFFE